MIFPPVKTKIRCKSQHVLSFFFLLQNLFAELQEFMSKSDGLHKRAGGLALFLRYHFGFYGFNLDLEPEVHQVKVKKNCSICFYLTHFYVKLQL